MNEGRPGGRSVDFGSAPGLYILAVRRTRTPSGRKSGGCCFRRRVSADLVAVFAKIPRHEPLRMTRQGPLRLRLKRPGRGPVDWIASRATKPSPGVDLKLTKYVGFAIRPQ